MNDCVVVKLLDNLVDARTARLACKLENRHEDSIEGRIKGQVRSARGIVFSNTLKTVG